MKKLIFSIVTVLFVSISMNAQSDTEEINFYQTLFGMNKQEMVNSFISPAPETSDVFWKIYDSYEVERKALGKERIDLLKKYTQIYDTASEEEINEMINDIMALSKANSSLISKYYKKMNKEINAIEAAQFFQIENYILSKVRAGILEHIPFFGEFK